MFGHISDSISVMYKCVNNLYLIVHDIMTLQTAVTQPLEQVDKVLTYIKTTEHYDGFVCSLIEDGQKDVVTSILGEDIKVYTETFKLSEGMNNYCKPH